MRMWLAGGAALGLTFLVFAASDPRHAKLAAIIDREWQFELENSPEMATAVGDNRYNDRLDDYSPEAYAKRQKHNVAVAAELKAIDPAGLEKEDRLNRTLMLQMLQTRSESYFLKDWEMPVNQMNGPHLGYAGMAREMPFRTTRDFENYASRLSQLPRAFNQITGNMRAGLRDRLMPPRYLLEKAAAEAEEIGGTPVAESSFVTPLKHFPSSVSAADREHLKKEIDQTISTQVLPAYTNFGRFLKNEYGPKGRTEFGIWSLPDGGARYRSAIREMTTTDMNPEQLHALGLKQVAQIDAEMLKIAQREGYSNLKSFNEHIFKDRRFYGTSGEQILALYRKYTDQMYAKLPQYFARLPKNKLVVIPMESYRAPHAVPADYSIGAGDGSRPGRINVNEYDPKRRLLLNAEAIAYHEGIPGHHLQFSIAQELQSLPPFRKFAEYNAYSEGWALYSETLAHEMGFYQDPYSEYGRLENLMWRSIRLVVDTGVHEKHWSRQQMIDFFHAHTAMDDQNIETEVDRYIAWPAQALGYKLGEMTILRLREKARKEMGAGFDIRKFHDAVLEEGPLPLDVLESTVGDWIASSGKVASAGG